MAGASRRERFKKMLPLLVLALLVSTMGYVWANLGHWLSSSDEFKPVDLIVVPAGEPDRRVPRALELVQQDLAKEVWVVPSSEGPVLDEPKSIEAYAKAKDVDVSVIGRRSRSLLRDARLVAARLRKEEATPSIAVINAPLELARTRLAFERALGSDVAVWGDGRRFDASGWWTSDRFDTVVETARYLSALALLGPGPGLQAGSVPVSLPLRALAGGFIIAAAGGILCRPLARRLGMVAIPRLWRAHTTPTPMLGGLAILLGMGGGIVAAGGVRLGALGAAAGAGVVVIAIVGLVDDIAGLGARVRLLWAAGAGAVAWLLGLRAVVLTGDAPAADAVNAAFTILWFMAVTFALNNFDNIDGSLGGVAAASAGALAVAGALGGQFVVAVVAAAVAGASLGYLVHNVHPARLFMGDMGALALGFSLAALALALTPRPAPPLSMAVPVIALGVPIFDTVMVSIHRMRQGKSPAVGGVDHTSHRLLTKGLSVRQSAAFLWGAQVVLGVVVVAVSRSASTVGWALVALFVVAGAVALGVFLKLAPWTPPWHLEASEGVIDAVEHAMRSLRSLEETVGEEAWRLSNPRAAKSTQETLKRLERVQRMLSTDSEGRAISPGQEAGT